MTIIKYFWVKLKFTLLTSLIICSLVLSSQEVSTIGEIYDFEIEDTFHYYFHGGGHASSYHSYTNIKILDKYYSADSTNVSYIRDFSRKGKSQNDEYYYYTYRIDTLVYTDLDSLIDYGLYNSVYTDSTLFNGRKISKILKETYPPKNIEIHYVNGCGIGEYDYWEEWVGSTERLVYYKKGDEEWGVEQPVSINDNQIKQGDISFYPNPSSNLISINIPDNNKVILSIYSLHGTLINKHELNKKLETIDISDLNSAIYILKFQSKSVTISKTLIKE